MREKDDPPRIGFAEGTAFRPESAMQLDFDLRAGPKKPAPPAEPAVLTVAALTRGIRELLESGIGEVWVEGEISNLRKQASGHMYFTLKDAAAQLGCVLFAGQAAQLRGVQIRDGAQVRIFGQITVYEARGQYQIIVRNVKARGEGALQAKFEELKRRLAAEGLFDSARKRTLPRFPRRIGVVTSPTGAAIRDFLHVLHRRQRGIEVVISPVRVQGRGAAEEIARAIREFGDPAASGIAPPDVIVVTRGGGSLEDLWEFNEEAVARAIAASPVPVVSAVGHEIDFTISDFAADFRAPTPSAAAEILAADSEETLAHIGQLSARLRRQIAGRMAFLREQVGGLRRAALVLGPERTLNNFRQALDRAGEDIGRSGRTWQERRRRDLERGAAALESRSPGRRISEALASLDGSLGRMERVCQFSLPAARSRIGSAALLLNTLNPRASLARGYTFTLDAAGRALSKAADVREGDLLITHFHDGLVHSLAVPPPVVVLPGKNKRASGFGELTDRGDANSTPA